MKLFAWDLIKVQYIDSGHHLLKRNVPTVHFTRSGISYNICIALAERGDWVVMKMGRIVRKDPALEGIAMSAIAYFELTGKCLGFPPQRIL